MRLDQRILSSIEDHQNFDPSDSASDFTPPHSILPSCLLASTVGPVARSSPIINTAHFLVLPSSSFALQKLLLHTYHLSSSSHLHPLTGQPVHRACSTNNPPNLYPHAGSAYQALHRCLYFLIQLPLQRTAVRAPLTTRPYYHLIEQSCPDVRERASGAKVVQPISPASKEPASLNLTVAHVIHYRPYLTWRQNPDRSAP
jgi:hypothetical protein